MWVMWVVTEPRALSVVSAVPMEAATTAPDRQRLPTRNAMKPRPLLTLLIAGALLSGGSRAEEADPTTDAAPSASALIADGSSLQGYRLPGLYGFNGGKPFYLERDPVTGAVDFDAGASDYAYEEDGIDRRDGPGGGSYPSELNNVRVHDYSNHKYGPLISSSYANTKVQGTASGHRPAPAAPTISTPAPSYYTLPASTRSTTTTTTTTPAPEYEEYAYDDGPGSAPSYEDHAPSFDSSHGYLYPSSSPRPLQPSDEDDDVPTTTAAVVTAATAPPTTTTTTTPATTTTTTTTTTPPPPPTARVTLVSKPFTFSPPSSQKPHAATSMPLGTHFHFPTPRAPQTPEAALPSTTEDPPPRTTEKVSPYGSLAEEPFRPIFGPGEGIEETHPPRPAPPETPSRLDYPGKATVPPFSFPTKAATAPTRSPTAPTRPPTQFARPSPPTESPGAVRFPEEEPAYQRRPPHVHLPATDLRPPLEAADSSLFVWEAPPLPTRLPTPSARPKVDVVSPAYTHRAPYGRPPALPNILPQFRPNAKVSHGHNDAAPFPFRQPPPQNLQPPPLPHLRRSDEEFAVNRRTGPERPHVTTLQMIQGGGAQFLPPHLAKKPPFQAKQPVFVVYPETSEAGSVVVGTRGPHLPRPPPVEVEEVDERLSPFERHAEEQTPLLQPARDRPHKNNFPYKLERPASEAASDEDDAETNVIPYLQDYHPFGAEKTSEGQGAAAAPQYQEAVVDTGGKEFTVSAVMHTHTHPQESRPPANHRPEEQPPQAASSSPAPLNFQAPFHASVDMGATPTNQGWSVVGGDSEKAGPADRADVGSEEKPAKEGAGPDSFDFENFKPQLFGGFKPVYSLPGTDDTTQVSVPTERQERQL